MAVEEQSQIRPLGQGALAALRLVSSVLLESTGGKAHVEVGVVAHNHVLAQMAVLALSRIQVR